MEFKEVSRAFYLASAAIALTACNPERRALPTVTPIAAVPFFQSSEIDQFYPDLRGIVPTDHGAIETNYTSTKWFNYSGRKFDSDVAREALGYFEKLSRSSEVTQFRFSDVVMQILMEPRPKTKRLMFIVSEGRSVPEWARPYLTATRLYFNNPSEEDIPSLTVVTVLDRGRGEAGTRFGTPAIFNTHNFLVETCQSSLRVRTDNPDLETFGQEIICNSLGLSASLRSQKATYQEYRDWARNASIRDHNSVSQPLYTLSESQYNAIPMLANIIS